MINRFSSRRHSLKQDFLAKRLKNAKSYKRIAGYFRSSIFELVGEEISRISNVQVVCNSDLDLADISVLQVCPGDGLKGEIQPGYHAGNRSPFEPRALQAAGLWEWRLPLSLPGRIRR
jgi:hypothetical protein